jgi:8-oxo-dGTP diphosphatase
MDEKDHGRKPKMKPFRQYITEAKANPYRYVGANPTVDLVVFREGDSGLEVLLIKRASGSVEGGKWAIPGGFVNTTAKAGERWKDGQTEGIMQAALRELEEETGLRITEELRREVRSVGIYKGGGRDPRDNKTSWSISYAFSVKIPKSMGNRVRGMDDASDARWYPLDRLPGRLAFDHKDILTDAIGKSKESEQRKVSSKKVETAFKREREGMSKVFGGLQMPTTAAYIDFAHPESPYEKPDQKKIEALRQKVWGVKQGERLPDLWIYSPAVKPSKGMRYITIRPLPRDRMFSAVHQDIFPEINDDIESKENLDNSFGAPLGDFLQGRIDHDRKVITAVRANKYQILRLSSSTIDRVFAELKKAYPGYKIYDQIDEKKLMPFSTFIAEAGRGLISRKNQWGDTTSAEVRKNKDVQQDIFDVINAAYKSIGGHPDFPDVQSVPADNNVVQVIDTDTEDDVDAVVLSKTTTFGKKLTTLGSDGGEDAKREVLKKAVDILKTQGNYVEASGKLLDILIARGAPVVKDEQTVRSVLKGKEIQWHGEGGSYSRKIGGKTHTKKMLGNPKI